MTSREEKEKHMKEKLQESFTQVHDEKHTNHLAIRYGPISLKFIYLISNDRFKLRVKIHRTQLFTLTSKKIGPLIEDAKKLVREIYKGSKKIVMGFDQNELTS